VEKISIARRRQEIRLLAARPGQVSQSASSAASAGPQAAGRAVSGGDACLPQGVPLPELVAALTKGAQASRRLSFALELYADPADPSRVKIELFPRPLVAGTFTSIRQAARILRLSPQTVRRALCRGELPGFKVGRQWRVFLDPPRWLARAEGRGAGCARQED
jgi:excisionase family DNA binding protein